MTTWRSLLLTYINGLQNPTTMQALTLWAKSEGMPLWTKNPLACGQPWKGSYSYNGSGVQVYSSYTMMARAVRTVLQNSGMYTAVLTAFRTPSDLTQIYEAINGSPWCAKCQGGHYPLALWTAVHAGTAPAPPPSTPTPTAPPVSSSIQTAWEQLRSYAAVGFTQQMTRWDALTKQVEAI